MMPDLTDITALGVLAIIILLAERWLGRMMAVLEKHLERSAEFDRKCLDTLLAIKESLRKLDKE